MQKPTQAKPESREDSEFAHVFNALRAELADLRKLLKAVTPATPEQNQQ